MYTISLLGCGKLGFPIALELISQGYNIKGSTTTPSKINQLKQSGIIPYLIKIRIGMLHLALIHQILMRYFS